MLRCARRQCSSASAEATTAPYSRQRSTPQPPPSRSSASTSATSASNALWPRNGGGWLRTSCVGRVAVTAALLRYRGRAELDQAGDERLAARGAAGNGRGGGPPRPPRPPPQ